MVNEATPRDYLLFIGVCVCVNTTAPAAKIHRRTGTVLIDLSRSTRLAAVTTGRIATTIEASTTNTRAHTTTVISPTISDCFLLEGGEWEHVMGARCVWFPRPTARSQFHYACFHLGLTSLPPGAMVTTFCTRSRLHFFSARCRSYHFASGC